MKRVLFSFIGVFITCTEVTALKCYICDSEIHGKACYDPVDTDEVKASDCRNVYGYQRSSSALSSVDAIDLNQSEKQGWDSNWNGNPTDFECVQFSVTFSRYNKRQFVRRCLPRNVNPNYCGEMRQLGSYRGYTLTKCDVCNTDYCNSSNNIKLSLVLNLIFFYIFYRCTDF